MTTTPSPYGRPAVPSAPAAPAALRLSAAVNVLLGVVGTVGAVAMLVDYRTTTSTDPLVGLDLVLGVPLLVISVLVVALTVPATRRRDRTWARVTAAVGATLLLAPSALFMAAGWGALAFAVPPLALLAAAAWPRGVSAR